VSYLLDTNVVSETTQPFVNAGISKFLAQAEEDELYLSVVSLAELQYGIQRLSQGAKRAKLEKWFADELLRRFEGRIFLMDGMVAAEWGVVMARGERMGQPISETDAWIAATASIHGLTIVTRNVGDFAACQGELLNPWE
jgi:predicted nucleic acid-binding protein